MKTHILLLAALGLVCVVGCSPSGGILLRPVSLTDKLSETIVSRDPGWFVSDRVVIIDVDGTLSNDRNRNGFGAGENPVSLFIEKLQRAGSDPRVKAVVVRINSPGGTVAATDMMYAALRKFRTKTKLPVVAIIEDMGASGGYYLACAADSIMAHHTSIVGSIGVIMQTFSLADMLATVGITTKAITSGPFKDMGSPLKPLEPKELKVLQGIVDSFYGRFVAAVQAGRPDLTPGQVKALADGRVFTGEQAHANGLVDGLGYISDAVVAAKRLAGVKKVKVVMYHRRFGYRANIYSQVSVPQVNLINLNLPDMLSMVRPQFLYLWTGHTPGK